MQPRLQFPKGVVLINPGGRGCKMSLKLSFAKFPSPSLRCSSPVVILHGMFGSKGNWKSISKILATELQRDVFAVDARNHGNSPHTPQMTYHEMSQDVSDFIQHHSINSCSLIGHSMGGKTAMTLALSQSHLVDQLVILDVAPSTAPGIDEMMNYVKLLKSLDLKHITDRRQASELLKPDIPDISVRSFLLTNLTRKGPTLEWRFNLNAIEENMKILKSFPNFDKEQYSRPTLFIGGDKSNYIRPEIYPEIKRLFPVAQIKLIEDCGHWIHADKPNELIQILKDFFN